MLNILLVHFDLTHGAYMHFKFKSFTHIPIAVTKELLNCQNTFQRFVLESNKK